MVKSAAEQLLKRKETRKRLAQANSALNKNKNWYPVSDAKRPFARKSKQVRAPRTRTDIQPGQVLIILSGRFRGRRVVYLKSLPSGLLLVTGPYKLNGVPLKRVNQAYVIPTTTRVNLPIVTGLDKVNDTFFTKVSDELKSVPSKKNARNNELRKADFFEDPKRKKERITEDRRTAQSTVDTEVIKTVREVPQLREYLQNRFALKNGDKPHLMKF